jgi:Holliday junction resolvase
VRYKLKKDEHHASISTELQSAGFCVVDTSRCGAGFPDLCISRNGLWCLVEIKTAVGKKSALQRLRRSQIEFNAKAKGPVIVAYTATEVIHDFNLLLKRREAYAI